MARATIIMWIRKIFLLSIFVGASGAALSEEQFIAEKLAVQLFSGEKVTQIREAGYGGLLEVVTDRAIYYTDRGGHVLLVGATVLDIRSKQNLSELREAELGHINFSELPLHDALKTVKGKGRRAVAIFQDANCGYCKKLEKELDTMDDVTVYTFLIGLLSPDSIDKGIAVWCAADREKAWHDVMVRGGDIAPARCEANPIARNTVLSKRLRVAGTPTLLLPSGKRLSGFATAATLEAALASATP